MRISVDDNTMVKEATKLVEASKIAQLAGLNDVAKTCYDAAQKFAHMACRELSDIPEIVEMNN